MSAAKSTVHGAISLVNAIATRKGATLGIGLKVNATIQTSQGSGIIIKSENKSISSRLINKTVEKIVLKKDLKQNKITINVDSEIPVGYGLKSSSAISIAVALACAEIFKPKFTDQQILCASVDASIESKVSITGAYDDACSCYYGGFNVTDNAKQKRVHWQKGPGNLYAIIFIPKNRKRGNLKKLKILSPIFENAWNLAKKQKYWESMIINGLATASILGSQDKIIPDLIEKGALGASISGNGPSIVAIAKKANVADIEKIFSALEGNTIISKINNEKAKVVKL